MHKTNALEAKINSEKMPVAKRLNIGSLNHS